MTSQARLCKQSSVLQLEHLVANAGPVWVEAACKQLQAPRTLGLLQWGCRCWRGCMACLLLLLTVDAATAAAAVVVVAAAAVMTNEKLKEAVEDGGLFTVDERGHRSYTQFGGKSDTACFDRRRTAT